MTYGLGEEKAAIGGSGFWRIKTTLERKALWSSAAIAEVPPIENLCSLRRSALGHPISTGYI